MLIQLKDKDIFFDLAVLDIGNIKLNLRGLQEWFITQSKPSCIGHYSPYDTLNLKYSVSTMALVVHFSQDYIKVFKDFENIIKENSIDILKGQQ